MNYYLVTTQSGNECWVKSTQHLKPNEIRDRAYWFMLDVFDNYAGPNSDPFVVIMESMDPGEKKSHLVADYKDLELYQ